MTSAELAPTHPILETELRAIRKTDGRKRDLSLLKLVCNLKYPIIKAQKWEVGGWGHIKNPADFLTQFSSTEWDWRILSRGTKHLVS